MIIKIGDFEFTEVWDGVLYKKLSDYPEITEWEIRTLAEFILYEQNHGRECEIQCENTGLLERIKECLQEPKRYLAVPRPEKITECTACPVRRGCMTDFVCHTTSLENARSIFRSRKLLSARLARGLSAAELQKESRNAANDPLDYFEYIMFAWGNCQAGDRLVMERKLERFPTEEDLSTGFMPGIRSYFRYADLVKHPGRVFDGVLPMKVKDEVDLVDWVYRIVIPMELKYALEGCIPGELTEKVIYVENNCKDIWEWSEKVYCMIEQI